VRYGVAFPIGFTIAALSACASTSPAQTNLNTQTFPNNCSVAYAASSRGQGSGGTVVGGLGLIIGFLANGQCEALSKLVPVPDSSIKDGVFRSGDGTVSVTLPEPLARNGNPGSQIWEDDPAHVSKVFISSTQSDGLIYAIYPLNWRPFATPDTLSDLEERFFNNPYFTASIMIGGENQEHVFSGKTILPDGSSAILDVLRPAQAVNATQDKLQTAPETERPYLLYYLIKSDRKYSIISIVWPNPCHVCSIGPEADIRNMDPRIATFVNSYRRDPAEN
jgi:hypothetical protein